MTKEQPDPRLKKLYPHLSDEELQAAEQHFGDYIKAVIRVAEEIENDPEKRAKFDRLLREKRNENPGLQGSLSDLADHLETR